MQTEPTDLARKLDISYRLLFERNPLPMCVYEVGSLGVLAVNDAAVAQYGYSKDEFVGLTLLDLHHEQDLPAVREWLTLPPEQQPPVQLWQHRHRDGSAIEVETITEQFDLDGIHARMMLVRDLRTQRRLEREQRELTERLTTTLESIGDGFFTLDQAWCFTYVNARAEAMLQRPRAELLGFNVWERFPDAVGSVFQTEYQRAVAQNRSVQFETYYAPLQMWWSVAAYPSARGLTVYFRDVGERHDAELRLKEERDALATVLNSTTDGIIGTDGEGRIRLFSPGAERIFGRSAASVQGQSMELLMPERFRAAHRGQRQAFAESGVPARMMGLGLVKGLHAGGQEVDLEGTIARATIDHQPVQIANLRDVTRRVRAAAEQELSRARLSDLTHRLMTQERLLVRRLAQGLHDQLGQTVAALRMVHEAMVAKQRDGVTEGADAQQAQMGTLIAQANAQVRQVLVELRPPLLEEQGLAAALDNELRSRSRSQPDMDISIHVTPEMELMRWPAEVEYGAFMIAREAVENALRHARATALAVRLSGAALALQLQVEDNGVGMATMATGRSGHLGILGMHERAHAIGAALAVESAQEHGTRVQLNWHGGA